MRIHTPDYETEGMYFARIVISLLMILIFLTFSVRINLRDRLMVYIGKISLYVYLLHGLVIDVLKNYLRDGLLILGSITAAIFGALCLSEIVDLCMRLYKRNGNKGKI